MNIDISIFFKNDDLDEIRNTDEYTIKQEEISQDVFFNYESDTVNNNLIKYIINILSRRYLDQSDRIEVLAAYDLYASNKKYRDSIS